MSTQRLAGDIDREVREGYAKNTMSFNASPRDCCGCFVRFALNFKPQGARITRGAQSFLL